MTRFSPVDCALEGFRLTRERPLAVALWGVVLFAGKLATSTLMVGTGLAAAMTAFQAQVAAAQQADDPEAVATALGAFGPHLPALALCALIGVVVAVTIYTALLRAVVWSEAPDKRFYIRLGPDEARQFGLALLLMAAGLAWLFVLTLVSGALISAGRSLPPPGPGLMQLVALVLLFAALVYPAVRLTIAAAATFAEKRVVFLRAWPATRDQFVGMLGTYALALMLALLVWVLVMIIFAAFSLAALMLTGRGMAELPTMLTEDFSSLPALFSGPSLTALVIDTVASTLVWVITTAPAPAIYRALAGAPRDLRV